MVIVVGSLLPVVKMWRWDPLRLTIVESDCAPTSLSQLVVAFTGQRQLVDVGLAAAGPAIIVMDFGPVPRHVATWGGAPAILRVEHHALVC